MMADRFLLTHDLPQQVALIAEGLRYPNELRGRALGKGEYLGCLSGRLPVHGHIHA